MQSHIVEQVQVSEGVASMCRWFNQGVPRQRYVSDDMKTLKAYLVKHLLEELTENFSYIPMYSKQQTESPLSPHSLFFQRQFWFVIAPSLDNQFQVQPIHF